MTSGKTPANNDFSFLDGLAYKVAPKLLGCHLERTINGKSLRAKIVEVEAYDNTDIASHSYRGKTPRTEIMFGNPGFLYVYFTYGLHYCCNVVVGSPGYGAAVLIRAVEPTEEIDIMKDLRGNKDINELTNGPAKLCQALAIDKRLNGHDLSKAPLRLIISRTLTANQITQTTRIGISQGRETPWRFYISGNPYISKK